MDDEASLKVDCLIIGAGMGGLAAAVGAARAGLSVAVLEQASALSEVGAGLTLGPNAVKALRWLGVLDPIRARSWEPAASHMRDWIDGSTKIRLPRRADAEEKHGAPVLLCHRADVQDALAARAQALGVRIVTGFRAAAIVRHDGEVTVTSDNGREACAKLLLGADGVHSLVRRTFFEETPALFSGYVAWRALVPVDALAPEAINEDSNIFLGPGHTFVAYRIRNGALVNLAAFAERSDWQEEGWSIAADIAEWRAEFADAHPMIQALLGAVDPATCFKWGLLYRDPLKRWVEERIALLGDAAHPMLPFLGQGAAMALEDGVILGRLLAEEGAVPAALARFERLRKPRTDRVQYESLAAVRRYHTRELEERLAPLNQYAEALDFFALDAGTCDLNGPVPA
jgi:salicylate hydroxylase